jgi:hypothetical protein
MRCPRLFHRLVVSSLAVVLLLGLAGRSAADYAAIAYSKSTGTYGYSYGFGTLAGAKAEALAHCDADDARIVAWVQNGYVSLALGNTVGAYGYGWASTGAEARARARAECQARTTGAYIAVTVYSGE